MAEQIWQTMETAPKDGTWIWGWGRKPLTYHETLEVIRYTEPRTWTGDYSWHIQSDRQPFNPWVWQSYNPPAPPRPSRE